MEQDVKKLVKKTEEDEKTYKRVAEERKQLEERVTALQREGLSEENQQELKRVQFCLSQPVFYTNPDKMEELSRRIAALEELIRKVEELIKKVEEVEQQYPAALGSSPSAPLARQPSDEFMNTNLRQSLSARHVSTGESGAESGMDSPSWHTKFHTQDLTEDPTEDLTGNPNREVTVVLRNNQVVQPIMLPSLGQGYNRPVSPGTVGIPQRRESAHHLPSSFNFPRVRAKNTDGETSPLYNSHETRNGNENQS